MSEDMKNLVDLVNKLGIQWISAPRFRKEISIYADGPTILKNVSGPMEVEQDETYEDMYTVTVHVGNYRFMGAVSQEEYLNYINKKVKVA